MNEINLFEIRGKDERDLAEQSIAMYEIPGLAKKIKKISERTSEISKRMEKENISPEDMDLLAEELHNLVKEGHEAANLRSNLCNQMSHKERIEETL